MMTYVIRMRSAERSKFRLRNWLCAARTMRAGGLGCTKVPIVSIVSLSDFEQEIGADRVIGQIRVLPNAIRRHSPAMAGPACATPWANSRYSQYLQGDFFGCRRYWTFQNTYSTGMADFGRSGFVGDRSSTEVWAARQCTAAMPPCRAFSEEKLGLRRLVQQGNGFDLGSCQL
jgi:hypothetical protein